MKKNLWKILLLLLCASMIVAVVAVCVSANEQGEVTSAEEESSAPAKRFETVECPAAPEGVLTTAELVAWARENYSERVITFSEGSMLRYGEIIDETDIPMNACYILESYKTTWSGCLCTVVGTLDRTLGSKSRYFVWFNLRQEVLEELKCDEEEYIERWLETSGGFLHAMGIRTWEVTDRELPYTLYAAFMTYDEMKQLENFGEFHLTFVNDIEFGSNHWRSRESSVQKIVAAPDAEQDEILPKQTMTTVELLNHYASVCETIVTEDNFAFRFCSGLSPELAADLEDASPKRWKTSHGMSLGYVGDMGEDAVYFVWMHRRGESMEVNDWYTQSEAYLHENGITAWMLDDSPFSPITRAAFLTRQQMNELDEAFGFGYTFVVSEKYIDSVWYAIAD